MKVYIPPETLHKYVGPSNFVLYERTGNCIVILLGTASRVNNVAHEPRVQKHPRVHVTFNLFI